MVGFVGQTLAALATAKFRFFRVTRLLSHLNDNTENQVQYTDDCCCYFRYCTNTWYCLFLWTMLCFVGWCAPVSHTPALICRSAHTRFRFPSIQQLTFLTAQRILHCRHWVWTRLRKNVDEYFELNKFCARLKLWAFDFNSNCVDEWIISPSAISAVLSLIACRTWIDFPYPFWLGYDTVIMV